MPPVLKKPAAAKPKAVAPQSKSLTSELWVKGELISPVAADAQLFAKTTLVSTSGTLWTPSGPLLTGEVVGKVHEVLVDGPDLAVCIEALFIEYPLVVEYLAREAFEAHQFLVWIHFCKDDPCMDRGARESRLHVRSIRRAQSDHPTGHLTPLPEGKAEERDRGGARDPGAAALQALARDLGFTGEQMPAPPAVVHDVSQPSLENFQPHLPAH